MGGHGAVWSEALRAEGQVVFRIELVTGRRIEVLGWWPDAAEAKAIAAHYRKVCPEGVVRVRKEMSK